MINVFGGTSGSQAPRGVPQFTYPSGGSDGDSIFRPVFGPMKKLSSISQMDSELDDGTQLGFKSEQQRWDRIRK
jgi:hypothetical protein